MKQKGLSLRAERVGVSVAGKDLLKNVGFTVETGALTALLGCNGAGKSTLLRALAGVSRLSDGEISLGGQPLRQIPPQKRARAVAYLPQELKTPFAFTVEELIGLNNNYLTSNSALDPLEIEPLRGRTLTTLSGGEKQRAALARALTGEARILLLDEPTAHLDLRHALRLLHHLRERARAGDAVLIATHDLTQCLPFADRALILTQGDLAFDGPLAELTPEILERCLGIERELLPEGGFSGYLNFS